MDPLNRSLSSISAAAILILFLSHAPVFGADEGPSAVPLDVSVAYAPLPVVVDGRQDLVYELHLTNMKSPPLKLSKIEVLDSSGRILAGYEESEIDALLKRPGLAEDAPDRRTLAGGASAIIFLDLILPTKNDVPTSLRHRLTVGSTSSKGEVSSHVFTTEPTPVRSGSPRVISPPLRGAGWLAANGISNTSDHRRSLVVVDGKARIAQRFATDFTRLRDGQAYHGDPAVNANWNAWGSEVLAVADAVVSDTHDGVPENDPTAGKMAVPITLQTVGGNYVILDLGDGQYAFYAHLQPGKIRVHRGEKVRRGQVLALLGNSGNSDAPHLHFHITDRNSPLGAEGLPYVFDSFDLEGKLESLKVLEGGEGWKRPAGAAQHRVRELPSENEVIDFAEK